VENIGFKCFYASFSTKTGPPAGMRLLGVGEGGANIQLKNNSKRREKQQKHDKNDNNNTTTTTTTTTPPTADHPPAPKVQQQHQFWVVGQMDVLHT